MRPALDIYEQIDLYLDGKLAGDELLQFEHQLNIDATLTAKVASVKLANELLVNKELLSLKAQMKIEMANIPFEGDALPAKTQKLPWKLLIVSVLSIVYGGVMLLTKQDAKPEQVNKSQEKIYVSDKHETKELNLQNKSFETTDVSTNKITINESNKITIPQVDHSVVTDQDHSAKENVGSPSVVPHEYKKLPALITENALVDPCSAVVLEADVKLLPTCKDQSTGEIIFDDIKNGISPYAFSVDQGKHFSKHNRFSHLKTDTYQPVIKDANGCITQLQHVSITEKECSTEQKEFAFNPQYNETFKFPVSETAEGKIQILTRTGTLVFTATLGSTKEWDGIALDGSSAKAGVYVFIVEFSNGKIKKGYVTLY